MGKQNVLISVWKPSSAILFTLVPQSGLNGLLWLSIGIKYSFHSVLGRSPFKVHYGYAPRTFGLPLILLVKLVTYRLGWRIVN